MGTSQIIGLKLDGTTEVRGEVAVPSLKWDAYDFKLRFTPDEHIAIKAAAASNGYVAYFLDMLDTAAATGTKIHADDALVAMAFYLLEEAGILDEGRSAQILGASS